jgi:DNA-binding NarL/FixJ family response regulator
LVATLIPDARFVTLDSNNHILLEDEPAWSHFLSEVRSFLGVIEVEPAPAQPHPAESQSGFPQLTLREREVLELIAQGYRYPEITQKLVLSPKTIRNYITIIFAKIEVTSRGEAIVKALEAGFGKKGSNN